MVKFVALTLPLIVIMAYTADRLHRKHIAEVRRAATVESERLYLRIYEIANSPNSHMLNVNAETGMCSNGHRSWPGQRTKSTTGEWVFVCIDSITTASRPSQ